MGKCTFVCLCVFSTWCVVFVFVFLLFMFSPCSSHKGSMCACQPFVIHVCGADWALPCFVWTTSFTLPCRSLSNYISPFGNISQGCCFSHNFVWYVRACVFCWAGHLSHSVNPYDSHTPTPYHVLPVFFLSLFSFSISPSFSERYVYLLCYQIRESSYFCS